MAKLAVARICSCWLPVAELKAPRIVDPKRDYQRLQLQDRFYLVDGIDYMPSRRVSALLQQAGKITVRPA